MSKKTAFLEVFTIMLAVLLCTQCGVERGPSARANGSVFESHAPDEAKIEIAPPDYVVEEKNPAYLQSLPAPKASFVFDTKIISGDELPDDVEIILDAHWKAAINYFYEDEFTRFADAESYKKHMVAWAKYCMETENKLQKSFIEAPKGYRKIYRAEATALFAGLNQAAISVIDKAKSL